MTHEWILDVLADLKRFADLNDLPGLSDRLDDTRMVAAAEIATLIKEHAGGIRPITEAEGRHTRSA